MVDFSNLLSSTFLAIFLLRFSPFRGARNGAPSRSAPSKVKHSSREVELMDLFVNCVSNAHYLGPFAVLFSTTAAAPRIYPSTVDKLLPGSSFDMRQVLTTFPIVVFNLSRRSDDGDGDGSNMLLLSALNTAMQESNATCTVQQRSHPMINLRPDPNASVPRESSKSSSFEEAAYFKTNPELAYRKAQSRGGDANTVLEIVSGFLLYGMSVSLEQRVFMLEGK